MNADAAPTMFELKYPTRPTELFPLIDEDGNVVGQAARAWCHGGSMALHPVVHLHIFSEDGQRLYLQKRSASKDIQPGKWDTAVGGHVAYGESLQEAILREAHEELGFTLPSEVVPAAGIVPTDAGAQPTPGNAGLRPLFQYIWQSDMEREVVTAFAIRSNGPFFHDHDEVDEGRFWSLAELKASLGQSVFTPQFEQELPRILPFIS